MRRIQVVAGPLVPLVIWTLLWWALGKPQMVLAGVIFAGFLVLVGMARSRLDAPEWATIRTLCTAGGLVLGFCCAVLAGSWNSDVRAGNPLAGEIDPLVYDSFEVVGQIVSWDLLPVANPSEYEEWEPVLVTVADDQRSFEFICDGRELHGRMEKGRTIKATGEYAVHSSLGATPIAGST